jgi:hypothetical protein
MKKLYTASLFVASLFLLASCSKEVKAPAKVANMMTSKSTTATQTSNPNQEGHTCGSHTSQTDGGY